MKFNIRGNVRSMIIQKISRPNVLDWFMISKYLAIRYPRIFFCLGVPWAYMGKVGVAVTG